MFIMPVEKLTIRMLGGIAREFELPSMPYAVLLSVIEVDFEASADFNSKLG
jgi:hypothetical protein